MPEAGYVMLGNDNPSNRDKDMIKMTYLNTTSHEKVVVHV